MSNSAECLRRYRWKSAAVSDVVVGDGDVDLEVGDAVAIDVAFDVPDARAWGGLHRDQLAGDAGQRGMGGIEREVLLAGRDAVAVDPRRGR